MRKDIHPPKVEGVAMAVVREPDEDGEEAWYVYLINRTDRELDTVLISSRGYGCLLYTSPSPRDRTRSRMPSSA